MFGSMLMGMNKVGADNNSEGSALIIKLADEDDDRPIWITFWGGGNTLGQSIWQVQQTRSESELKSFLNILIIIVYSFYIFFFRYCKHYSDKND